MLKTLLKKDFLSLISGIVNDRRKGQRRSAAGVVVLSLIFLLLFVSGNQSFKFNLAHLFVVGEVSRVALEVAVEKLVNLVDCYVEKIAVVAYE